jgi:hypothetical protein
MIMIAHNFQCQLAKSSLIIWLSQKLHRNDCLNATKKVCLVLRLTQMTNDSSDAMDAGYETR